MNAMSNNRGEKEIRLNGNIPAGTVRSLVQPVQVFITDTFLKVNFNASLGTISLFVYDETGSVVYRQSVNTYAGQQIRIDITAFEEGEYTIELVNSQNEYLCGSFEI